MPRRFRRTVLLFFLPLLLMAQQPATSDEVRVSSQPYVPQPYTFRAEASLVEVDVVVRDGHGRPVAGLGRENFRVFDEGKAREIAGFSENGSGGSAVPVKGEPSAAANHAQAGATQAGQEFAARPRYLAFFFDDMNSAYGEEAADIHRAQSAAVKFVKTSLHPEDYVGIFSASGTVSQDFAADPGKLLAAIGEIRAHPQFADKVCAGMNAYQAYRIAQRNDRETIRLVLAAAAQHQCPTSANAVMVRATDVWDKVKASSLQTLATLGKVIHYLGGKAGDRILVLTSTGFVGQTMEKEQDQVIDDAVHFGVVINSLVTKGLFNDQMAGERFEDPAPEKAAYQRLPRYQAWAKAENEEVDERPMVMDDAMGYLALSTGGVFFHNNNDLNAGFRQTSVAPKVIYRLSFDPKNSSSDAAYHRLRVSLANTKPYSVEARPGYFAEAEAANQLRAKLDAAVQATTLMSELNAAVTVEEDSRPEGQRAVRVRTHVDIRNLPFTTATDRQRERITVVAALFDSQGKMVAAKEGTLELALKRETFEQMAKTGINAEFSLPVSPGRYQLRAVVQEAAKGEIAASTQPVEMKQM